MRGYIAINYSNFEDVFSTTTSCTYVCSLTVPLTYDFFTSNLVWAPLCLGYFNLVGWPCYLLAITTRFRLRTPQAVQGRHSCSLPSALCFGPMSASVGEPQPLGRGCTSAPKCYPGRVSLHPFCGVMRPLAPCALARGVSLDRPVICFVWFFIPLQDS